MAVQLLTNASSAILKSIGLENSQTTYWFYFAYCIAVALMHLILSGSDRFSPQSQQKSFRDAEHSVSTEEGVKKAA